MQVNYYTKYDCSLCDQGLSILGKFPEIDVKIVDVEEDHKKYQAYLLRIPVISYANGEKELAWPFAEKEIEEMLSAVKMTAS